MVIAYTVLRACAWPSHLLDFDLGRQVRNCGSGGGDEGGCFAPAESGMFLLPINHRQTLRWSTEIARRLDFQRRLRDFIADFINRINHVLAVVFELQNFFIVVGCNRLQQVSDGNGVGNLGDGREPDSFVSLLGCSNCASAMFQLPRLGPPS